ncbi:Ger(x)C family spore germination protein [Peribacillus simplex]|uniref:Ger(x)C family spore germination protein n=1 Tax=Peribacillus simplex TaxID=1478 RepID=UPI003D2D530D
MSRKIGLCLLILVMILSGCMDATPIEEVSVSLILGLDLDEEDNLLVYMSSPIFSKEAKDKEEVYEVKSYTLRHSREKFDARVIGLTSGSKTQLFLVGKRLLKKKDWFDYLDPFFRDPKNTVTAGVVAVDGSVADVIFNKPTDKPRLSLYLTSLIDTASKRNIVKDTSLQDFHRQMKDKGRTAWITQIKKKKRIELTGSALLAQSGQYKITITPEENQLLNILDGNQKGDYSITIPVSMESANKGKPYISFSISDLKVKKKVKFNGRFVFDINVDLQISISEQLFPFDVQKDYAKLEKSITNELENETNQLIQKIQKSQIDPLGLGLYARAYTYQEWKKVQEDWGNTLAKSKINIHVKTKIKGIGSTNHK